MKFLNNGYIEFYPKYHVGEELILDVTFCLAGENGKFYTIDRVKTIEISKEGIKYYFEEAEIGVMEDDILGSTDEDPHFETELKEKGYKYVNPYVAY